MQLNDFVCVQYDKNNSVKTVNENQRKSKGLYACNDIKAGTMFLSTSNDSYYDYILHPSYWENRCQYCLESKGKNNDGTIIELNRCGGCKKVCYCSRQCQKTDWKLNHKYECKNIFRNQKQLTDADIADTILVMRCNRKKDMISYKEVEDMVVPSINDMLINDKNVLGITNQYNIPQNYTKRLLSAFDANNFGISHGFPFLQCIGSALWPQGAILNHSCKGNCIYKVKFQRFQKPIFEFRALEDIRNGEELCHAYIDLVSFTSMERQEKLKRYGFMCNCENCLDQFWTNKKELLLVNDIIYKADASDVSIQAEVDMIKKCMELCEKNNYKIKALHALFPRLLMHVSVDQTYLIRIGEELLTEYRKYYHKNHPSLGVHISLMSDLLRNVDHNKYIIYSNEAANIFSINDYKVE